MQRTANFLKLKPRERTHKNYTPTFRVCTATSVIHLYALPSHVRGKTREILARHQREVYFRDGVRFSKVPITFRARSYILKLESIEWKCSF